MAVRPFTVLLRQLHGHLAFDKRRTAFFSLMHPATKYWSIRDHGSTSASTHFSVFSSPNRLSIQLASHVLRFFSSLLFDQTRSNTWWVAWLLSSFFASFHDATPLFLETFSLLFTHHTWKSKKLENEQTILKTWKTNKTPKTKSSRHNHNEFMAPTTPTNSMKITTTTKLTNSLHCTKVNETPHELKTIMKTKFASQPDLLASPSTLLQTCLHRLQHGLGFLLPPFSFPTLCFLLSAFPSLLSAFLFVLCTSTSKSKSEIGAWKVELVSHGAGGLLGEVPCTCTCKISCTISCLVTKEGKIRDKTRNIALE